MLLVIFGAGASYDSAPHLPLPQIRGAAIPYWEDRPPLANELFDIRRPRFAHIMQSIPECLPIIPYLQKNSESFLVERVLSDLRAESSGYPERLRQLAAIRYYLQSALSLLVNLWNERTHGVTNYKTLLDQIALHRRPSHCVYFVTFNYDTLLDTDFSVLGVCIRDMSDYISHSNYKLVKLHGSTDWGRQIITPIALRTDVRDTVHEIISVAPTLAISQVYQSDHK